jgi:hypothetical protein
MKHQRIEANPPAFENPTPPVAWIEKALDAQATTGVPSAH